MIENYFTILFTVYRGVWSDGKMNKTQTSTFYGYRQRAIAELSENLGISYTKGYTIWCPVDADVFEQDKIVDGDGNSYMVKALNNRDYGKNQHLEIVAEMHTEYASV